MSGGWKDISYGRGGERGGGEKAANEDILNNRYEVRNMLVLCSLQAEVHSQQTFEEYVLKGSGSLGQMSMGMSICGCG